MSRRRITAAALLAILALAACGAPAPTPTGSPATTAAARSTAAPDPSRVAEDAAFGPWRRSPIRPTSAFASAVEDACRADPTVGTLPLAVLDARGEGRAMLVFADATAAVVCRARVADGGAASADARPVAGAPGKAPADGRLGLHDLALVEEGSRGYSMLVGQVGGGVNNVSVQFDADAAWYQAAMDNGWYAIWWPGAAKALAVSASDARHVSLDGFTP